MKRHVLLLKRVEGPIQAWGLRSRWHVRDSGDEPTKSGLLGLLGCALGYPSKDPRLEELDSLLSLGVRVEYPGTQMLDFQTVSGVIATATGGYKGSEDDPSTIVSPRTYLQDAAFLVVFDGPNGLLEQCAQALQSPKWPIYLGRKSCIPTRPVFECLTDEYESIEDALNNHRWSWDGVASLSGKLPTRLRCSVDDPEGWATRADRIRVNPARMYQRRSVRTFWTDFPKQKEDVTCTSQD